MPLTLRLPALVGPAALAATLAARALGAQAGPAAPVTLREVVESAVAGHPTLESARARVRAARGTRTTAGTLANPVLAYEVENAPFPGGPAVVGMARENMTTATLPLAPRGSGSRSTRRGRTSAPPWRR